MATPPTADALGCAATLATPPAEAAAPASKADDLGSAATLATPPAGATPTTAGLSAGQGGPADAERLVAGTVLDGRFQLLRRIGAGGMGTVFLARQTAVDRAVALKFLHPQLVRPSLVERFHREALAASKLSCPNSIVIHDFGQAESGQLYIAMEYLDGRSLAQVIGAAGALPALRAVGIGLQILGSLEEAHLKGIVHRDLKPDNIMLVNRTGTSDFVKVLDFGIAKLGPRPEVAAGGPTVEDLGAAGAAPLTREGTICGSPGYMAPEQIVGGAVDQRADLYAFGVILYEMLSGTRPVQGDSLLEIYESATEERVEPLARARPELALPAQLDQLVLRCLRKDPAQRPQDAAELAAQLRALTPDIVRQQQEQDQALMDLVGIRRRWPKRLPWLLALAGLLLALGAAVLGLRGGQDQQETALRSGDRLFVAAAEPQVPRWVHPEQAPTWLVGRVLGATSRALALRLARGEVLARVADVPPRFDPQRERRQYLHDIEQLSLAARGAAAQRLRRQMRTYWAKFVQGAAGGHNEYRFDGYAAVEPPAPALSRELRRQLAELRYDRYSFLADESVRRRHCARARQRAARVRQAIEDLAAKGEKKQRLRFILDRRLAPCRPDGGTPDAGSER